MIAAISKDPACWDAYVESSADAWNYHRWIWKQIIEETYGHESLYLTAAENGAIRGILPLFSIRSRLFGNSLVSIPFFSYSGVLAGSPHARNALLSTAIEYAQAMNARYIELRQSSNCELDWEDTSSKVRMQVIFPKDPDGLFNSFNSKLRNVIRRRSKHGFDAHWDGIDSVKHFYEVFAVNMRNLGTPVYPKEWFLNICRYLPTDVRILTIREGPNPVASAFLIAFRDTMEVPWSASVPEARSRGAAMWLEWKMLEWAAQNGYRRMDLGRSTPGSGSYHFKKQWANHETPLHWYRWSATRGDQLNLDSLQYRLAVKVWKRLPLQVANHLGPLIVRSIP